MSQKRPAETAIQPMKRIKNENNNNLESDASTIKIPTQLPKEILEKYDNGVGKLLISGMINWERPWKNPPKNVVKTPIELLKFHRFTDEKYRAAISGPCSVHTILINIEGKAFGLGQNANSQLGHENLGVYHAPTPIPELDGYNIISAATGRCHTLFLTDMGTVLACGENKSGQCGIGKISPMVNKPTLIKYSGLPIVKVGCGADFSVLLDSKGYLHAFGLPEYGQLGNNTEGKYFITANKLSFHYETIPKRIVMYVDKDKTGHFNAIHGVKIEDFSCGPNHTVAIDSEKRVFSWGFGGYGRLGHAETKDEMMPRLIKYFVNTKANIERVVCGSTFSIAVSPDKVMYLFGLNRSSKTAKDANMYPKPIHDLSGWKIHSIGCGTTSTMIVADDSLIAWGAAPTHGELGLGESQKSSAVPIQVPEFIGTKILQVTMGMAHTILLIDTENHEALEKYEQFDEYVVEQ
uniref:CSON014833 protein n=1 Tax=Culicoides sonorensis TaxID=179676 RepID=A0A336MC17_CULSO